MNAGIVILTAVCIDFATVVSLNAQEHPLTQTEGASPGESPPIYGTSDAPKEQSAPVEPAVAEESPSSIARRIAAAEASLANEPSLFELRQAALALADADKAATDRWKRSVRASAVLPTLKVGGDYGVGRDEALDRYQDRPDRWGADTDRGFGVDVSMQWKLDRLVFNSDELKVYDSLADRAARRENLSAYLIGIYFERRRLQLESILLPSSEPGEALTRRLRIEELSQIIDALTGGLLSRKINQSRTNRP